MTFKDLFQSTSIAQPVNRVQFGVLSSEQVKAMSVCEVTSTLTYQGNKPVDNGLYDLRMGTCLKKFACKTCAADTVECPGHFGHIPLASACYHIGFISTVLRVLRCVCPHCSRLLLSKDDDMYEQALRIKNPSKRLKFIEDTCKNLKSCGSVTKSKAKKSQSKSEPVEVGCGNSLYSFNLQQSFKIMYKSCKPTKSSQSNESSAECKYLPPDHALCILERISDADCKVLGFDVRYARPDWFILKDLPVAPPVIRPSVDFDGMNSYDDLSLKYIDIIKANKLINNAIKAGTAAHILTNYTDLLQYHVAVLIDNELSNQPASVKRDGKPFKSLRQRLVGKEGRVRSNLMGKRVDFSARTVITADPTIGIDQVGVPRSIANNLTVPETVTHFNHAKLTQLVAANKVKTIQRTDGMKFDLQSRNIKAKEKVLQLGYTVERMLQDGDIVLMNRQPSLHKMSMMAHKAKILPYSSFRLNLSCTTPYNADFDGDEMNLHVPQTYHSRSELANLVLSPTQIISPQSNKPVMGIVQDALVGVMLLSLRDTFLARDELMNLLLHLKDWDGVIPLPCIQYPKQLWSGKQLFSMLLPSSINFRLFPLDQADDYNASDAQVYIDQGCLVQGVIDKRTVGTSQGSLIHVLWLEYGPSRCAQFFNECQLVVNNWLLGRGFSCGLSDTVLSESTLGSINSYIQQADKQVQTILQKGRTHQVQRQPGCTMLETVESCVNEELRKAVDASGKIIKSQLGLDNGINCMVSAGSKGSMINISQIIGCVGQQNVNSKRIGNGFRHRTLPHFCKHDLGMQSKGFVQNSYISGLTPQEFYFHAMGGREGVIDTAIKTAETGYIQRRLVKAMEDVMIKYDSTVRNSSNQVVQFAYGDDGFDPCYIEKQRIDLVDVPDAKYKSQLYFNLQRIMSYKLPQDVVEELLHHPAAVRAFESEYMQLVEDRQTLKFSGVVEKKGEVYLPVHMKRLISSAQRKFGMGCVCPLYVVDQVHSLIERLQSISTSLDSMFYINLRNVLASKRVVLEHRLTQDGFDWLIGEVESKFVRSLAHPGESVGCIAAQSIGEPATQMTLNTFHLAGVGNKNVTQGVPRLNELLNLAKNPKSPSLCIHLQPDYATTQFGAKRVLDSLEFCVLKDIVACAEVVYDPVIDSCAIAEDREFIGLYLDLSGDEIDKDRVLPWMIRLTFDRVKKENKLITNQMICDIIEKHFDSQVHCIAGPDNVLEPVIHVRFYFDAESQEQQDEQEEEDQSTFYTRVMFMMLESIAVSGVKGINKVFMRKDSTEWLLDTEGINLSQALVHAGVDATRTTSNVISEVFQTLGIEAARSALMKELRGVIENDGSYVNLRHIGLLCDVMTSRGYLMPITRHGISKTTSGPLMRCSFEQTAEVLMEAAMHGECDVLKGVSENVMLGRVSPFGTGSFDTFIDMEMLAKHGTESLDEIEYASEDAVEDEGLYPMFSTERVEGRGVQFSPVHPTFTPMYSPSSPGMYSKIPYSPSSPGMYSKIPYSPSSPVYSKELYSPSSPAYTKERSSQLYSPSSPGYTKQCTEMYSPSSPAYTKQRKDIYSPSSPGMNREQVDQVYSPSQCPWSPSSPVYVQPQTSVPYSPSSPVYRSLDEAGEVDEFVDMYTPTSPGYKNEFDELFD